jgi:hypothetical protein
VSDIADFPLRVRRLSDEDDAVVGAKDGRAASRIRPVRWCDAAQPPRHEGHAEAWPQLIVCVSWLR